MAGFCADRTSVVCSQVVFPECYNAANPCSFLDAESSIQLGEPRLH
ncbi:MAG TPA: hypothetical protein DIS96_17600 [Pusillimonas sp.]|nr:hypothetical protein [Pusillimonas sp.]